MRRKLFRLSVAFLALAAASAAAPNHAAAFINDCPHDIVYEGTACSLWNWGVDCSNCFYTCNGIVGIVGPLNECVD